MRLVLRSALFVLACAALVSVATKTALAWNAVPSQPSTAIFYPGEVQVGVEEDLTPEALAAGGSGFMLVLPPGVERESFLVSVNGLPAGGYFWLDKEEREAALAARRSQPLPSGAFLPENETSPERRALLEKYVALAQEAAQREGTLAATQARLELWQKALAQNWGTGNSDDSGEDARPGKGKKRTPDDLSRLDASFAQLLPGLHLDRDKQQRALEDTRLRLARAETALRDFDQKEGGEIVVVPWAGEGKTRLRYGYALPAACSLSYRLSAQPDKENLTIAQDVALSQHSGFTWTGVDTYVSTLRRDRTLRPIPIHPWLISLAPKGKVDVTVKGQWDFAFGYSAEKQQSAVNQLPMSPKADMRAAPPPAPTQEERSTFRLWSLGRQRIEHKTPVRLSLATDTYNARYYYTLRPVTNPKGFLTAELALPAAIELPPGPAQFSVDGVSVGQQPFSFNGDKGFIFLGSDPQVTATVRDLNRSSGEQGFISKDQTLSWHWRITLKSTRAKPVEVLLEDPVPDTVDESVVITAESSPKPEQAVNPPEHGGAKVYRWKTTLKPGEPFVIDHKVRAVAPKSDDKELNPGRRP